MISALLLPGYWLLRGYFMVTAWLLPVYYLVIALLLPGYFLVTFSLLPGYFLVTTWSVPGYCLVVRSAKGEICFICSCAITFQLAYTVSPSVVQHAYTSSCSVSCSVNPVLYASQIFITV